MTLAYADILTPEERADYKLRTACQSAGSNSASRFWAAVRRGHLRDLRGSPCSDCGRAARQHDHRDYDKWWDVVPVCVPCNVKRGRAKPFLHVRHRKHTGKHVLNQFAISMLEATTEPFA